MCEVLRGILVTVLRRKRHNCLTQIPVFEIEAKGDFSPARVNTKTDFE